MRREEKESQEKGEWVAQSELSYYTGKRNILLGGLGIDGINHLDRGRASEVIAVHGDSRRRVTTVSARSHSGLSAGSVGAAVLAVRDAKSRVGLTVLDSINSLDGASNVGKVDECCRSGH